MEATTDTNEICNEHFIVIAHNENCYHLLKFPQTLSKKINQTVIMLLFVPKRGEAHAGPISYTCLRVKCVGKHKYCTFRLFLKRLQ
jgi:hypothetical protein